VTLALVSKEMIPFPPLILQLIAILPITLILIPTLLFAEDGNRDEAQQDADADIKVSTDGEGRKRKSLWIPFSFYNCCGCRRISCCKDVDASRKKFDDRDDILTPRDHFLRIPPPHFSPRSGEFKDGSPRSWRRKRMPPPHTSSTPQVCSDVDDTFMCSGAGWKGGSDRRFQPHVIYPGAPEFYLALSRGPKDDTDPEGIIWMSARAAHTPIINYIAGEIDDRHPIGRALVAEGIRAGCLGFGTKGGLYGKFSHNLRFSRDSRNSLKGEHKYHNLMNYMEATPFVQPKVRKTVGPRDDLDPTMSRTTSGIALAEMVKNDSSTRGSVGRFFSCDPCECQLGVKNDSPTGPYIFLGDNGEGDEKTAIRLLEKCSDRVAACFIQDVTGRAYGQNDRAQHLIAQGKLFYFTTYLGAAIQAFRAGLISRVSLARVYGAIVQSPFMLLARRRFIEKNATKEEEKVTSPDSPPAATASGEASAEAPQTRPPLFVSPRRPEKFVTKIDIGDIESPEKIGRDFGKWCQQIQGDLAMYDNLRMSFRRVTCA